MFKQFIGTVKAFGSKHSTAITVGVSILGYAASIATAISETRTFDARIEELKISNNGAEVPKKEIAKAAAKSYWLTAVIFGVSTTSLIMGQRAAYKKTMALTTAYQMSEKAFREYKRAVAKTITEKKKNEVDADYDKEQVKCTTKEQVDVAEHSGFGDILCMDRWTGRMWYDDPDRLQKIFNEFNADYIQRSEASHAELLESWGLTVKSDNICHRLLYRLDVLGEALRFYTNSALTQDNIPVLVVGTSQYPQYDLD